MAFLRRAARPVRWTVYLVLFLVLLGSGRLGQQWMESFYFGERTPYLQVLSDSGVTLRWHTSGAERGQVHYGKEPGRLDQVTTEAVAERAHELRLSELEAGTRYWYRIGNAEGRVRYDGADHWFMTAPPPGTARPVRLWVLGDSGYPGEGQRRVRDAALAWMAAHPRPALPELDLLLTLGDNAYTSGRNSEFQSGFFEPYAAVLKNVGLWPVYGNHDARRWAYYDIFTLPEQGEAGGLPSGTESWFSFDYGPLHVVVLDSEQSDRSIDGPMLRWLKADLAAHRQPWQLVLLHHPPYTRAGHNSDEPRDSRGRMVDVREKVLPLLEAAGVDLVLAGHTHAYERSHLLDCHYGRSDTLAEGMVLARGGMGAEFRKPSSGAGPHEGTVYVVAGSSSKLDGGPTDHPVMAAAMKELGSLVIDIDGPRLEAHFIDGHGAVRDRFAIVKGAGTDAARPSLCAGESR